MNLLAHAYLSFHQEQTLVGNMISDDVKGKQKDDYPPAIQTGIQLHRLIDSFTDQHPAVREASQIFRPLTKKYAGAFIDISFDYFLANDPKQVPAEGWQDFTKWVYLTLDTYNQWHPSRFSRFYPFMRDQDWLYHYRFKENISKSLENLLRRARYLDNDLPVRQVFLDHQQELNQYYQAFFPALKAYAWIKLAELS